MLLRIPLIKKNNNIYVINILTKQNILFDQSLRIKINFLLNKFNQKIFTLNKIYIYI